MKKLGLIALVLGLFVLGTVNVSALTEAGLKEKLFQTIKVDGVEYELTKVQKKQVEDYLNAHDISDADATYIGKKIDKAIEIIKGQGNVNFTSYPQSVKDDLKGLVNDISRNTDNVRASLTKDGLLIDGYVITELVKKTGYETSKTAIIAGISFLIVAVGTCLVIKQVKTSE